MRSHARPLSVSPCALILLAALAAPARAADLPSEPTMPEPIVYTGHAHYTATGKDQLARLHLIPHTDVDPGDRSRHRTTWSAIVVLYLGGFDGHEYIGLPYDRVLTNSTTHEMLLQSDDGTLPTIRLGSDATAKMVGGSMSGQTIDDAGTLSLTAGWDAPASLRAADTTLDELGGIYAGYCTARDGSAMNLRGLELVPSRMPLDAQPTEGVASAINYVGNGICKQGEIVNCVSITSGTYDVFHDTVTLNQGAWTWKCTRPGPDTLSCTSPRYPSCTLGRTSRTARTLTAKPRPAPATMLGTKSRRLPSGITCADWQGNFEGALTHVNGGRVQPAALRLAAFDADGVCALSAIARLDFSAGQASERMTFNFAGAYQDPYSSDLTLIGTGDILLQLRFDGAGGFVGQWYSRLYGLVGTVRLGAAARQKPQGAPVPGLPGHYLSRFHPDFSLDLATTDASDARGMDPYRLRRVTGSTLYEAVVAGRRIPYRDGVGATSYDYITDLFVMRTAGLMSGSVGARELKLHGVTSRYLGVASPLETEHPYVRWE
jgi:hypothetical protein